MKMLSIIFFAILLILFVYAFWYNNLKRRAKIKASVVSQAAPQEWSASFLEEHRSSMDPVADAVVNTIFENNEEEEINHIFKLIRKNNAKLPDDLPPRIKKYFEDTAVLPDWADKDLIQFGQENYIRHGLPIGMLLFYKSLPECYTGANGAEVLQSTSRLNSQGDDFEVFSKRMSETGLFIYNCMMPGGLSPNGKGIRSAQKVRLIHAVIRHFIKNQNWDTEKFGEPINQEDMAGTLMSFSALILEGLQIIGINFDTTEAEAYIHCWRVVGHIMGVHPDLIPNNSADAIALGHAIVDNQKGKSPAGLKLTQSLLAFCNSKAPFFIKKDFHTAMMRMVMEDEYCNILEIPQVSERKVNRLLRNTHIFTRIREFLDSLLIFAFIIRWVDKVILRFSFKYLGQKRINYFFLPKSLTKD